jgi:hypothetical protein
VEISRYIGDRDEQRRHFDATIRLAPHDFHTREFYMTVLELRWGGSYAQMEKFVQEPCSTLRNPKDAAMPTVPAHRGGDLLD